MTETRQKIRDLALGAYLRGQRRNWPVPRAARSFVHQVFGRQVEQFVPIKTDEWGRTFDLRIAFARRRP